MTAQEPQTPVLPAPLATLPAPGNPTRVVALRGLPASGKSTAAKAAQAFHPPGTVVRINNDELAIALLGPNPPFGRASAALLGEARTGLLRASLTNPAVRLVIIDNTNLNLRTVQDHHKQTLALGGEFVVEDTFLSVDPEECILRDKARMEAGLPGVGAAVINEMAANAMKLPPVYEAPKLPKLPVKPVRFEAYDNNRDLPGVWLVDMDGTLALMGERSPYDWKTVGQDTPNTPVVDVVKSLLSAGKTVVVMSGRDERARTDTQDWLDQHVATGLSLHMRAARDTRPDYIVKHELFTAHIADRYRVEGVLDDRDQVVDLWRRQLKLPTFQVADGNF